MSEPEKVPVLDTPLRPSQPMEMSVNQEEPPKQEEVQEDLMKELNEISMIIRASQGIPLQSDSIITQLTDVKNIMERSRFPTYPMLAKNIYLRLIAKYHPFEAKSCEEWADTEAHALIGYKGGARAESVEMNKAPAMNPQVFPLGSSGTPQEQQPKRHFWSRGQPKEQSEFEGQ